MEAGSNKKESSSKLLDNLKKSLLELTAESGAKTRSNRDICNTLNDLTNNVIAKFASNSQLLPSTIELLVYAYSNVDQDIRLAASENLRKLIKSLMNTHLYKLQLGLFHELKKNGSSRSMCIVLDCFSSLYSRTRPQKCHGLAQLVHPVLIRIFGRKEEMIHDNLIESLSKILPTMTPFLTSIQVQSMMTELLDQLTGSTPSFRRMMAAAITLLCVHSKVPHLRANWIINKLLAIIMTPSSSQSVIQGVLQSLLSLLHHSQTIEPSIDVFKQMYSLSLGAVRYGDHNTSNVALELIENLLTSAIPEFRVFLTTPLVPPTMVQNIWSFDKSEMSLSIEVMDDNELEAPCDTYFEHDDDDDSTEVDQSIDSLRNAPPSPNSSISSWSIPSNTSPTPSQLGYLIKHSTSSISPLVDIVTFIHDVILSHSRVSVKSLGLAVITGGVAISPHCLKDLTQNLIQFMSSDDPKLVSRMSHLLAHLIASELRNHNGMFHLCRSLVGTACKMISSILGSDTPVVLKAACESLRICLGPLISSSQPNEAVLLLEKLLSLTDVNYWLLKVELLQTLAIIDYGQLGMVNQQLLSRILEGVVMPLLSDNDYRVRCAVANTLVRLADVLDHTSCDPLLSLARRQSGITFGHLHVINTQLSLAGIGRVDYKPVQSIPWSLEFVVCHCSALLGRTSDSWCQRGAIEALCSLSSSYPPPTFPSLWGISASDCGLLETTLQLLRGSWLSWQVQTHHQLLQLSNSLFLACALDSLHAAASEGRGWEGGAERVGVIRHSTTLLLHIMKLLNIFLHVIEGKDPSNDKEARKVLAKKIENTLSPKSRSNSSIDHGTEALGTFSNSPHYCKLYNAVNSAYTNYKVSIDPSDDDKFSSFLCQVHSCLAAVFEVSLAEEVCRHVEEVISYLSVSISVDAPGALLCVQQLLNALFGMNVATQQTHLYSPFLSSLPYALELVPIVTPASSIVEYLVELPLKQMKNCLNAPPPATPLTPAEEHSKVDLKKKPKFWLFGAKRNLVLKPLNSLSSIKDYLVYFENLVVSSIHLFSQTSSLLIQERVLFMMVQLLHLKVRYDLLDCNGTFLDSVNLIVNLMESGSVKGGAQLVPHLFQFLVMLAHDQSKKVSIPEVMQKCDAVMASNQNMTSFAIPALQPLVLYLFVRPNPLESTELRTQREVALNMLLRLIDYSRVIQLLICVLECYQSNAQEWSTISSIVFAALLPPLGRLQASLDTPQTLSSLHQLLTAMTPSSISIQALLLTLSKQTHLSSITSLTRWLSLLSIVLRLLSVIFPEDTLKTNINNFQLTPPTVNFVGIVIEPLSWSHPSDEKTRPLNYDITQLAMFLVDSLHLGLSSLSQLLYDPLVDHSMLSLVLSDILLVIRILVGDDYVLLREALGSLPLPQELFISFLSLSHSYPSLIISFTSLLITCGGSNIKEWMNKILVGLQDPLTPHQILLVHCLFSLVPSCSGWVEWFDPAHHSTLLLSSPHGPALIKDGYFNDIMMTSLRSLIDHSPSSSLTDSMNVLCVVESAGSHLVSHPSVFKLITDKFVGHSNKAISLKAMNVLELLIELGCEVSPDEVNDIMKTRCVIRERSPSLWNKLDNLTDHQMTASDVVDPLTPLASSDAVITVDEEWHKELIVESFASLTPSTVAKLLLHFDAKSLDELLNHAQFDPALLEECLVHSIFLILTRSNSMIPSLEYTKNISIMLPANSETLFLTSVNCLIKHVQKWVELDSSDHVRACHLTRSLVWFLISLPLLPSESMGLTDDMNNDLIRFSLMSLSVQSSLIPHIDTVAIQSSIHLCLMVLQNKGLVSMVTDEWVVSVTRLLAKIVQHEYDFVMDTPTTNQNNELVHQLNSVLTFLLMSSGDDSLLHWSLKSLSVTLARHQMFFPSIYFPPILTSMEGGGPISIQLLDRSLADSDILQEYMQRTNVIGWKSRNHFEELWMQLLGVLNSPQPSEEMLPEEMVAHSMGLVSGVRGLTSLLMSTILRPSPGNPSSSVPMHTHRNKDFNFLSSPAGKKLLPHRALIEFYILKDTGLRPNSHAHYQLPLMNQGTTFPPVYCRNLERPLGSAHLTPGQLSYTSLVPVILKVDVTKTTSTSLGPSEVDIRSCLMSIIDFYKHLLSQSIDLLLLHHIVSSTVMLSDLFVLSSQYEWMFDTFMSLIDSHPIEDELTESLLIFGVIKCATVLRLEEGSDVERICKLIESSLFEDKFINVQNSCMEGLLYVVEDGESAILTMIGPALAKYIQNHLSSYQSYSEHHMLLVWTLATHLVLLQGPGQLTKDVSFTSHLLELINPIISDPSISSHLHQSIMMGLEYMVLSFALSYNERATLRRLAASRFVQSDHTRSLSALGLLLTCMYTGEEADRLSGLSIPQDDMASLSESVYQSREHISNILERLRQGNEPEVEFLIHILPNLIVDFLPCIDGMNMVVSEVISQQQSRPWLAALIMNKTFELLMTNELDPTSVPIRANHPTVFEWVLLSLDSFIQQEPENTAIWSITCLLMAASLNPIIRASFDVLVHHYGSSDMDWLFKMLCIVTYSFYHQNNFPQEQRRVFLDKFDRSSYISLHKLVHNLRK